MTPYEACDCGNEFEESCCDCGFGYEENCSMICENENCADLIC